MAYSKQTWINDDPTKPLSASRMGHIEDGIETAQATAEAIVVPETKADIGLANVDNTADAAKPVSTATQTALDLKAPLASPTFTGTVAGVTKAHVGLGSVDNTADSAKAVLSATKLTTSRTIALTGAVAGSVGFDGTGNVSITTTQTPAVASRAYNTGTSSWPARPTCTMCISTGGTTEPGDAVSGDLWVKDA